MTEFTYSAGKDLVCIVCAALAVAVGCGLYAIAMGWVGL